jgi:hypothetical protein
MWVRSDRHATRIQLLAVQIPCACTMLEERSFGKTILNRAWRWISQLIRRILDDSKRMEHNTARPLAVPTHHFAMYSD